MANLIATADGNLTAAATWALVDATSLLDSQAGNFALATAPTFSQGQNTTPGAITIDGIAVKVATRAASPSGTITVRLFNVTGGAAVAGTTVTINVSDLPQNAATAGSTFEGCSVGWTFFKFAAPVLLLAATNYRVEAQTSVANQVNLFRDGTANNMARMLRTTTTQAPAAGDNMFVMGEWTAAATMTARTVTMDSTANTDYGGGSTSLASFGVSSGGTVNYGTTGATNYYLKLSGILQVWLGGVFNIGTTGTPIPRTSTAVLEFDCVALGDFGVFAWGTFRIQGLSRTAGKDVSYCLLTADAAGGATALTVGTDTGWLNTDEIAISGTTRTNTDAETGTLNADAGASSLSLSAGLGVAHGGDASTSIQAEIILLTRNVIVRSTSTTAGAYFITGVSSTIDLDWVAFRYMFATGTSKTGLEIRNTSGTVNVDHLVFRDSVTNGRHLYLNGTIATTLGNIHGYTTVGLTAFISSASAHTGAITLNDSVTIVDGNVSGNTIAFAAACLYTLARIYSSGGSGTLVTFTFSQGSNFANRWITGSVHSTSGIPIALSVTAAGFYFDAVHAWHTSTLGAGNGGFTINGTISDVTWANCKIFGCALSGIGINSGGIVRGRLLNCLFAGTTTGAQARGILVNTNGQKVQLRCENTTFGVATGPFIAHTTADIGTNTTNKTHFEITLVNSPLASATEFDADFTNGAIGYSFIARQRKDGTTNTHEKWYPAVGTISYETTTFRTAAPSEKLAPVSPGRFKLESSRKRVAVPLGMAATIGVYVRKDGSYSGAAPRLIVLANPALGLDNDLVLDTMSGGSGVWEQLTGTTTPVADEDGVLECFVDCDGSAGAVYVDDWSASVA